MLIWHLFNLNLFDWHHSFMVQVSNLRKTRRRQTDGRTQRQRRVTDLTDLSNVRQNCSPFFLFTVNKAGVCLWVTVLPTPLRTGCPLQRISSLNYYSVWLWCPVVSSCHWEEMGGWREGRKYRRQRGDRDSETDRQTLCLQLTELLQHLRTTILSFLFLQ